MTRVNSTGKESASNFSPDNGTGAVVRTAMKDVFESLRTLNSASGDPSGAANLAAYQPHIDTDTNLLKIRNAANSAFVTIGNVSQSNLGLLPTTGGTMTGAILGHDGSTAAAPAFSFDQDTDLGFFRHAANTIGISTGGVMQSFLDSNGLTLLDQNEVRFMELTSQGTNHISVRAPNSVASNKVITLPDITGTLLTDGAFFSTLGSQDLTNLRNLVPNSNNTFNLGSPTVRWAEVYTNDLNLSNEGSKNDVDGTWGSYTIQEGKDSLFLLNKRNGKKYKFDLTEVT